ncbi:hypothetical protein HMPREF9062_2124 [Actinomyces sp. oral taxon 448 str. F0400]|nr:hypothetical protein HMPREF9062_2124 [Actinomyces sp. oral taxon 448 str. F0400]
MAAGGIIPARAGFTISPRQSARCAKDHPRSRGVYDTYSFSDDIGKGSSPLARGLRRPNLIRQTKVGIIPARAGFTKSIFFFDSLCSDHPRSRGVYPPPRDVPKIATGSSPLARGLPWPACYRQARQADHPRSRGVYTSSPVANGMSGGSSPLARGLPRLRWCDPCGRGIIPARAGFTSSGIGM